MSQTNSTAVAAETLKSVLDKANPNQLADVLRKIKLGTMLTPKTYDSGTIAAVAAVPLSPPALIVQSARVVTSGTGASVGTYAPGDAGSTPTLPTGGASAGAGVCAVAADGTTVTFPNTVTRVVITYIPRSDSDMTAGMNGDIAGS